MAKYVLIMMFWFSSFCFSDHFISLNLFSEAEPYVMGPNEKLTIEIQHSLNGILFSNSLWTNIRHTGPLGIFPIRDGIVRHELEQRVFHVPFFPSSEFIRIHFVNTLSIPLRLKVKRQSGTIFLNASYLSTLMERPDDLDWEYVDDFD